MSSRESGARADPEINGTAVTGPVVVLDDDPTGAQMLAGVRIALDWSPGAVGEAVASGAPAVHILTNSRALSAAAAHDVVASAARSAVATLPDAKPLLRGDSTLRAHLVEEYDAVSEVLYPAKHPPLLLVPALPSAGRITRAGVHLLRRSGQWIPLHHTEYARDKAFAYKSAHLLTWAEERSNGRFPLQSGAEVSLSELRESAGTAVTDALAKLDRSGGPAVCVPDAETLEDLELIAAGLRAALRQGTRAVVRCGPAFAGVFSHTLASGLATPPSAPSGLLVISGSYVPTTQNQLSQVRNAWPRAVIDANVGALAGPKPEPEIRRLAEAAGTQLKRDRLAVVALPGLPPSAPIDLAVGERIATNLSEVVHLLETQPSVIAGKGGTTSAVLAKSGLKATQATVIGPIAPGVSLWEVNTRPYIVFPGNVGGTDLLLNVIKTIRSYDDREKHSIRPDSFHTTSG